MEAIRFDFNHMMSDFLGEGKGISRGMITSMEGRAADAVKAFNGRHGDVKAMVGWVDLPENQDETVDAIIKEAAEIRANFENFVVLGIGGSALGPIAIQQALSHLRYNELPAEKRNGPRFYVEDNIDPERMSALLDVIDVKKTCFNVITKSGGTAETMSQYLIALNALKEAVGPEYNKHIIATTSSNSGLLLEIAHKEGFKTFFIPDDVGGRFSEMCPVGLLPAAVCGIDIKEMLAGAKAMKERCTDTDLWKNPALMQATAMYLAMTEKHANITVMMPYADSRKYMADWYCQLWAESLGKAHTRDGKLINAGSTPVKSLGVTDQHSQLQLYSEGPLDKVVTFLAVDDYRAEVKIPKGCEYIERVDFLSGKTLNQLIQAELLGTEYALTKVGRMSQKITLPTVNANTIGQLMYFFELATAYAGELLGIDAFDQPGVEQSKIASYAVLGNKEEKYVKAAEEMSKQTLPFAEYVM